MKQSAKLSIDLITTIIVTLIAGAVTVAAVISMAWFASNKEVGTNGSSVTVDADLFELGVENNVLVRSVYPAGVSGKLVAPDSIISFLSSSFFNNVDVTTPSYASVLCDLQIDSKDFEGDEEAIRPGSYGKLIFKIIPKKAGLTFNAEIKLIGIKGVGNTYSNIDDTSLADERLAYQYLNGHILLFTDEERHNLLGNELLDSDEKLYIIGATTPNEEYTVTLYWEWAQTYERIKEIINDSDIHFHDEVLDPSDEGETKLTSVRENSYIFYERSRDDGYNDADQVIGDHIQFVLADIVVQKADESGPYVYSVNAVLETGSESNSEGGGGGE